MSDTWFLVLTDYRVGSTLVREFRRDDEAMDAYAVSEQENRNRSAVEVVLIAAENEAAVRELYPHLFDRSPRRSRRDALERLRQPAYLPA